MRRGALAYVYAGPGSSRRCVLALCALLRHMAAGQRWQVRCIGAAALRLGLWRQDAALICLPGGRDLPYLRLLAPQATRAIVAYVRSGGSYFGSCAGAYFACRSIHFAAEQVPKVTGRRPLALFAGEARGPSQGGQSFAYGSDAGRATLWVRPSAAAGAAAVPIYNQGGCVFVPPAPQAWPAGVQVLAWAAPQAEQPPQAVALRCRLGRGRALLWGAHPELSCAAGQALLRQQLAATLTRPAWP